MASFCDAKQAKGWSVPRLYSLFDFNLLERCDQGVKLAREIEI